MSNCEPGANISCGIRCMESSTVEDAMRRLDSAGVERVSYTCQLSAKEEAILLIGDLVASRLADVVPEAEDSSDARLMAGLYSAELCECDVATLTRLPENEVVHKLRRLTLLGVLAHRELHSMNYYRLESDKVRHNIEAAIESAEPNQKARVD